MLNRFFGSINNSIKSSCEAKEKRAKEKALAYGSNAISNKLFWYKHSRQHLLRTHIYFLISIGELLDHLNHSTRSTHSTHTNEIDGNVILEGTNPSIKKKKIHTFGGFKESRSKLWNGFYPNSETSSLIHLGVDFNNLVEGQSVYAVLAGTVIHSWADPSTFNGWGGRIIIHNAQYDLYLLYGHLEHQSLPGFGTEFKIGDQVGRVGQSNENGSWYIHLHFQVMTAMYMKQFEHDLTEIDGYSSELPSDDEILDPFNLLKLF